MTTVQSQPTTTLSLDSLTMSATASQGLQALLLASLERLTSLGLLKDIFPSDVTRAPIAASEGPELSSGISFAGFTAWPVFLGLRYGSVEGATFNRAEAEKKLSQYWSSQSSVGAGLAILEAVRNIGQHGHRFQNGYPGFPHDARAFEPGAVLAKEITYVAATGGEQKFLLCMVTDEGRGILRPDESLVHGVGNDTGNDNSHQGMGFELEQSTLYLVNSRAPDGSGSWLLFDGLTNKQPEPLGDTRTGGWGGAANGRRIEPICGVKLPLLPAGCQKVMIIRHPSSDAELLRSDLLEVLSPLLTQLKR